MSLTTNCPKCGKPKAHTLTTSQAPQQYAPGCSPADDVAYLMWKQQQQLVINQLIAHAWHERMYGDVPEAPAIMLTPAQAQEQKRALAANQQRMTANADEDTVPDPPAIMLAPVVKV